MTACVAITNCLITCARRECTKGKDLANSLESLKEINFNPNEPVMKVSTSDINKVKEDKNTQFKQRFEVDCATHKKQVDQRKDNKAIAVAPLWNQKVNSMKAN